MKDQAGWVGVLLWTTLIVGGWWVIGALFGVAFRAAMWVIGL